MQDGPVFVGGLDRSGKSALRLYLSAHPAFAMTRRTYLWTRFYNRFGDLRSRENFERCLAALLRHRPMHMLWPDPERIRREFWQGEPSYARLFALLHQHYAERLGKPRWGDQTGLIERYADPIFQAYPNARMIHMIRDPRERYEVSISPNERRSGKAGAATARWLYSVRLAQRNLQRYPDHYKIVRYEALVADTEATLRDVCAFLGEAYLPSMLSLDGATHFGDDTPAAAAAGADQRVREASRKHQGAQKQRDLAFIQTLARREMTGYGYAPHPIRLSRRDRLLFYLLDWPANLVGMLAWYTRAAESPA